MKVSIGAGKVVKGWEQGLVGAWKGCKRILVLPPDLAYGTVLEPTQTPLTSSVGAKGMPPTIPSNAVLCFVCEIDKVKHNSPEDPKAIPSLASAVANSSAPAQTQAAPAAQAEPVLRSVELFSLPTFTSCKISILGVCPYGPLYC